MNSTLRKKTVTATRTLLYLPIHYHRHIIYIKRYPHYYKEEIKYFNHYLPEYASYQGIINETQEAVRNINKVSPELINETMKSIKSLMAFVEENTGPAVNETLKQMKETMPKLNDAIEKSTVLFDKTTETIQTTIKTADNVRTIANFDYSHALVKMVQLIRCRNIFDVILLFIDTFMLYIPFNFSYSDIISSITKLFQRETTPLQASKERDLPVTQGCEQYAPLVLSTLITLSGSLILCKVPSEKWVSQKFDRIAQNFANFSKLFSGSKSLVSIYELLFTTFSKLYGDVYNIEYPGKQALEKLGDDYDNYKKWYLAINHLDNVETYDKLSYCTETRELVNKLNVEATIYGRALLDIKVEPKFMSTYLSSVGKIKKLNDHMLKIGSLLDRKIDPFCVWLTGAPGQGKSFALPSFINAIADKRGFPKKGRIYCKPSSEKFWSNYAGQFAVVIDDIGQVRDQHIVDYFGEFMIYKSNTLWTVNMSDNAEKGKPFTSEVVFCTTNSPFPQPEHINTFDAIYRRRDLLIETKCEGSPYKQNGTFNNMRYRLLDPMTPNVELSEWMDHDEMLHFVTETAFVYLDHQDKVIGRKPWDFPITQGVEFRPHNSRQDHLVLPSIVGEYFDEVPLDEETTDEDWFVPPMVNGYPDWTIATAMQRLHSPVVMLPNIDEIHIQDLFGISTYFDEIGQERPRSIWVSDVLSFGGFNLHEIDNNYERLEVVKEIDEMRRLGPDTYLGAWNLNVLNGLDGFRINKSPYDWLYAIQNLYVDMPTRYLSMLLEVERQMQELIMFNYFELNNPFYAAYHTLENRFNIHYMCYDAALQIPHYQGKYEDAVSYTSKSESIEIIQEEITLKMLRNDYIVTNKYYEGSLTWENYLTNISIIISSTTTSMDEEYFLYPKLTQEMNDNLNDYFITFKIQNQLDLVRLKTILDQEHYNLVKQGKVMTFIKDSLDSVKAKMSSLPHFLTFKNVTIAIAGIISAIGIYKLIQFGRDLTANTDREDAIETMEGEISVEDWILNSNNKTQGAAYYTAERRQVAKRIKPHTIRPVVQGLNDTNSEELISNRILKSLVTFKAVRTNGRIYGQNAFRLAGNMLLLNRHAFYLVERDCDIHITLYNGVNIHQKFDPDRLVLAKNYDLAIYMCDGSMPPAKNNIPHLLRDEDLKYNNIIPTTLVGYDMANDLIFKEFIKAKVYDVPRKFLDESSNQVFLTPKGWTYNANTSYGMCGAMMIASNTKLPRKIIGFHSAKYLNSNDAFGTLVTQEMISEMQAKLPKKYQTMVHSEEEEYDEIKLGHLQGTTMEVLVPFHQEKNDLEGNFSYYKKMHKAILSQGKTSIKRSPIFEMIKEHQTEPAILHINDPRMDERQDPLVKQILSYGQPIKPFEKKDLIVAMDQVTTEIMHKVQPLTQNIDVLTESEAINGIPDLEYYDRMDMHTSPGYPYTQTRKKGQSGKAYLFKQHLNGDYSVEDSLLRRNLDYREHQAKLGYRSRSIWTDCLKDERRKLPKIKQGNTRSFTMGPVDYTILARKYMLHFCAAFYAAHTDFFSSVGITPESSDWTRLYERLNRFGPYSINKDYEKFDRKTRGEIIEYVCELVVTWYGKQHDDEFRNVIYVLLNELTHTNVIMRDLYYMKHQGIPSGNFMTVIINTIINAIYLRFIYRRLCRRFGKKDYLDKYSEMVGDAIYGDDDKLSPRPEIVDFFNFTNLKAEFAIYGINITPSSKDEKIVDYEALGDGTYLKRMFKQHDYFKEKFLAPIELTTIYELTNWITDSNDEIMQIRLNCEDALKFAFHYGFEFFSELKGKINAALTEKNIDPVHISYDTCDENWLLTFK